MDQSDILAGTRITTYIVAGHPRSGTSMMMHALVQGGLEADYKPEWDAMQRAPNGYVQNPMGFYELSFQDQLHPWFPMRHWGKLIKVQYVQLGGLAPGRYLVVFMLRHPREIRMSYQALGEASARQRLEWVREEDYEPLMKRYVAATAMRVDMNLLEVWYPDVVANPLATFEKIREFGFPIDAARAANTIDPALYRHRIAAAEA
jgi:hypothetical protein